MAKKEIKTDLWVYDLLKQADIELEPQGSSVKEIDQALKTASKKGTGKVGFPEYVGAVKDYLLVVEDKADLSKHKKCDDNGNISMDISSVINYAVNGAIFYGKHLANNTSYKKVLVFGVSGDEKRHRITPVYIDETEFYRELPDVESFISFNESNIDEYYIREVLKENTDDEKETAEILRDASVLHEDLRNYGNLLDTEKPLIVSGILLALRESEYKNFSVAELTGDKIKTDGQKIYDAINSNLQRANVSPEVKKDKILSQFAFIKDTVKLNEIEPKLQKTPLRYFAEYLNDKIYKSIRYMNSAEDYIGRFYGEFMSYSGGDGQTLGIILTPKHITQFFCDLANLQPDDVVFDPCCGTAGFLIAAMYNMLAKSDNEIQKKSIRQKQLHGIELRPNMFTIATTNMILRGDGKSNLIDGDFFKQEAGKLQLKQATVGMMNPPYSQGSKQNPDLYELSFVEHLLNSLVQGARCLVIVPQSSMTGKTKEEQNIKENIFKYHTLEGVITLNKDTFYGVGTTPCIAIFTAGEPHPADKICKFINFENDGYKVAPHVGLVETESAKDKKQHLLDVWFDRIEAETKFCVKTTVEATDEWLHSFYYFNDEIPCEADFMKTVGDYLDFEFSMIMQGREDLFNSNDQLKILSFYLENRLSLKDKEWNPFLVTELFSTIQRGKRLKSEDHIPGEMPYVSSSSLGNGVDDFVSNTKNVRIFADCLSLANSGSVGTCFYEPFSFVASDHITHLKNEKYNKHHYLFLATILNRLSQKYNFNREINDNRISRERILLPVGEDGKPDFIFMENYTKNQEKILLQKYLKYIEKRIEE